MRFFQFLLLSICTVIGALAASDAHAVTVDQYSVLPNAVSFEYFGLNQQQNVQTSNTVGTLIYTGHPGCGGTCSATTQLGSNPSVSATVSEVDIGASGGSVQASLGYYVAYINNSPGAYNVTLHTNDSVSSPDGQRVSAHLAFGPAASNSANFNNFSPVTFEMADCPNGCPAYGISTGPFGHDNLVQMVANTLYFIQLDLLFSPRPDGVQLSALIDPAFTTDILGGQFIYSPGVFSAASETPLPAALPLFAGGLGVIGFLARRRKRKAAAIAA